MPADYVIDPERRLVHVRMWGVLTASDIRAIRRRLVEDTRLTPGFSELIDARGATSIVEITTNEIRSLAGEEIEPVSRRAFVTTNPAAYGLARMFQTYRSIEDAPEQNEIFHDIEQAEAWLSGTAID